MKKIKCNCGRLVQPKEKQTFLFDGLIISCRNCGTVVSGSGFGYQEAAKEIESKLKELRNQKTKIETINFKPKKFKAQIKLSKRLIKAIG